MHLIYNLFLIAYHFRSDSTVEFNTFLTIFFEVALDTSYSECTMFYKYKNL